LGTGPNWSAKYGVVSDYMPDGWRAQQAFPFRAKPGT